VARGAKRKKNSDFRVRILKVIRARVDRDSTTSTAGTLSVIDSNRDLVGLFLGVYRHGSPVHETVHPSEPTVHEATRVELSTYLLEAAVNKRPMRRLEA
jgi:hypothetical protein